MPDSLEVRFLTTRELTLSLECLFLTHLKELLSTSDLSKGLLQRLNLLMQLFHCTVFLQRRARVVEDSSLLLLLLRALPLSVLPRRKSPNEPLELDYLLVR